MLILVFTFYYIIILIITNSLFMIGKKCMFYYNKILGIYFLLFIFYILLDFILKLGMDFEFYIL